MGTRGTIDSGGEALLQASLSFAKSSSSGATSSPRASAAANKKSWWNRGGMHVNEVGMAINIVIPLILLNRNVEYEYSVPISIAAYVFLVSTAYFVHGMRTAFCVVACPAYLTSLLAILYLDALPIYQALAAGIVLFVLKVAICMSACLHRYAAHAAFKCGPGVQLLVTIIGCCANQGGAIWWASQHRLHHKKCDVAGDPHSQYLDGVEQAFAFFQVHGTVEEQFAPKHCDTWYLRILDTWSFVPVSIEFAVSYYCFGKDGLFLAYVSAWFCQTLTLWFNISNHPAEKKDDECKAVNYFDGHGTPKGWYPLFFLLDLVTPLGIFVGELNHRHHHDHFELAKRNDTDLGYYMFIYPLELLGLVWDVKVMPNDCK